jgi:hypothetical protein
MEFDIPHCIYILAADIYACQHTDTLCYVHRGINNMCRDVSHNRTIEAIETDLTTFPAPVREGVGTVLQPLQLAAETGN